MRCALIENNVVTGILELTDAEINDYSLRYQAVIDVSTEDSTIATGWLFDGSKCSPPTASGAATVGKKITKLALRNRLTLTEKVTIETAASSSALLRAWIADFNVSNYVDLSRADTIAGLNFLEQSGLIGAGRASTIINAPITDTERYKGIL